MLSSSFTAYKDVLLPYLRTKTSYYHKSSINKLKDISTSGNKPIDFIRKQPYTQKDTELEKHGYKVIRNVFKDKSILDNIALLSNLYDVTMEEFADKDIRFTNAINPILTNKDFIEEYENLYGEPFLWQKTTIHRKHYHYNSFVKDNFTAEHIDITETPNSKLTITAYIAATDQSHELDSKLMIYPDTHKFNLIVPAINFDYVSSIDEDKTEVYGDINNIIHYNPDMAWIRECLYHLIVLDIDRFNILKSTFILLMYNPLLFHIKPVTIDLKKGDVLFFLADVLHGATVHRNPSKARVSLAVRGGIPYYEQSNFVLSNMKYNNLKQNYFLFSGTKNMLEKIIEKDTFSDIIYEIDS